MKRIGLYLAALALLPGSLASGAPEPPLDLEWSGPPECPGRETVLDQIGRMLGEIPASTPRLSVEASVSRWEDGRWHVRIATPGESGGERLLDSQSCSSLTRAVALVLAIRLKPTLLVSSGASAPATMAAGPAPPPPVPPAPLPMPMVAPPPPPEVIAPTLAPPPPSPPRRPIGSMSIGVSAVAGTGELPSVDVGGEVELAYTFHTARIELHGETELVQEAPTAPPNAAFRAAGGGARGCYAPAFGRWTLFGCGDVEIDAIWASGQGYAQTYSPAGWWVTLGLVGGARVRLTKVVGVRAFVEPMVPLSRPQFVAETPVDTYTSPLLYPSAAWVVGGVGVDATIF